MVTYGLCTCGNNPTTVPLEGVHVEAKVVDMIAQVSVVQYYCNNTNNMIECRYVFPLDSYSAVCGFEAEINGEIIVGKVKEKEEARKEYKQAIARGDGAYLLEESKGDIFEVFVGNVPPHTRVNIWITYITELKVEADEATRFILPTTVAPRYTPASSVSWHTPWYEVFTRRFCLPFKYRRRYEEIQSFIRPSGPHSFSVMIEIESPTHLIEVVSPSHCIKVDNTSDTTAFISFLHGDELLGKDFILNYKISDPHKERAIIECEDENSEKVSAMVTLVPDFELDDVKTELIFVVDRSGSMSGKFINQAKDALQLFLRALPMDCYFNIIGFGSNYTKLYDSSKKYSQSSLNEATSHVNAISANLGGTELMKPLNFIFSTPTIPNYSRNIFVLTDGQVSNTEQVCDLIRKNSSKARLFSLGVGSSVSHELVEGMARAGKGNARFIVDGQRMDTTIMRQLKDAIQPSLTDVSIDWGFVFDEAAEPEIKPAPRPAVSGSLIGHRSKNSTPVPTPRKVPACFCQAPFNIPPIFSGSRFIAYAFLRKVKGSATPRTITITAQSPDGPLSIALEVEEHSGNLVQKLTARALIRDLEEGSSWLHSANNNVNSNSKMVKDEIVRLGTTYNLVSKHTSFIAVEHRQYYYQPPPPQLPKCTPMTISAVPSYKMSKCAPQSMRSRNSSATSEKKKCKDKVLRAPAPMSAPMPPCMSAPMPSRMSAPMPPPMSAPMPSSMSAPMPPPMSAVNDMSSDDDEEMEEMEEVSYALCENLSIQEPVFKSQSQSQPLKPVVDSNSALQAIVMLQQFDGSFLCNAATAKVLSLPLSEIEGSIPASIASIANKKDLWASALIIQYLALALSNLQSSWEMISDKTKSWLRSNLKSASVDVNSILSAASSLLTSKGVC